MRLSSLLFALVVSLGAATAQSADLGPSLYPERPPPPNLRVLVLEIDAAGQTIARHELGDPAALDWWPASTVKLFAAIAALERIEALGFDHRAQIAFERLDRRPYTRQFGWLVTQAITHSSNLAYDRLVQFVGADALHADLLGPTRGLSDTALQVPYSMNVGSLLESPALTVRRGTRRLAIPASTSDGTTRCPMATCTSLNSLAEAMRRVMLHASLPAAERLRMSDAAVAHLRAALAGKRARGREVINALAKAFGRRRPGLYHKPGYYPHWRSDVVFVDAGKSRWVIALANDGGRKALNDPVRRLARWLAAQ